jgi:glutamate racemase
MRIGVFYSGIGGLTVLKSLIDKHPNNNYYCFGDSKNLPYGNKSKEELLELSKILIPFL